MGWNAVPCLIVIGGIWAGGLTLIDSLSQWREGKTVWAYNKDYYQRALLRRDWYLHREEESVLGAK
ncbi:mitochondrial NADH:ubiquinone oxidoreductase 7.5 kDa subunit [Haematococcus lacustris]